MPWSSKLYSSHYTDYGITTSHRLAYNITMYLKQMVNEGQQ